MDPDKTINTLEGLWTRTRKVWISAFLLVYFTVNIILLLPKNALSASVASLTDEAWSFADMHQNWSVFGPDLRRINYHSTATVLYDDGSIRVIDLPRPELRSLFDKIRQEKFRKYLDDSLPWPPYSGQFAPDTSRYIARRCALPGLTPVLVSLRLNWIETPRPSAHVNRDHLPPHTRQHTYFIYRVKPGDLRG